MMLSQYDIYHSRAGGAQVNIIFYAMTHGIFTVAMGSLFCQ